jgi:hypothetical protein
VHIETLKVDAFKSLKKAIDITKHTHSLQTGGTSLQKSVKKIEPTLVDFFQAVASNDPNKGKEFCLEHTNWL